MPELQRALAARVVQQVRLARLVVEADPVGWLELSLSLAAIYFGLIWAGAVLSPGLASPALLAACPPWGLGGAAVAQISLGGAGVLNLGGRVRYRLCVAGLVFVLDFVLLTVLTSIAVLSFGTMLYFALLLGTGVLLWRIRRTPGGA